MELPTQITHQAPAGEPRRARGGAWRQIAALLAVIGAMVIFLSPRPARKVEVVAADVQALHLAERRAAEAESDAAAAKAAAAAAAAELSKLRARLSTTTAKLAIAPQPAVSASPPLPAPAASASVDCTTDAKVHAEDASTTIGTYGRAYGNRNRLGAICKNLAPAVAVRPAPSPNALSSRLVLALTPWVWGDSSAHLDFDPDGLSGALSTPWGDGRWGSLPRHPNVLWASFSSRSQ